MDELLAGDIGDVELQRRAAAHDQSAWHAIVARHGPRLWATLIAFGLDRYTAEDVSQTCWLRLLDHLGSVDEIGPWIRTVGRNEARRVLKARARTTPSAELTGDATAADGVEQSVVTAENHARVRAAFAQLDDRCQQLLRALANAVSYATISREMGLPVSHIGPTRGRCLDKMRGYF